jgi:hypothetical protein
LENLNKQFLIEFIHPRFKPMGSYWGKFYQKFWTIKKYMGIPIVIFIGKVTASAMGKNRPKFAFGTVIFMAAGTAI